MEQFLNLGDVGVELSPVLVPGWNFSPVCNTKLYQNQTRDYMTKFSTQGQGWVKFNPVAGVEISTLLQPAGLKFQPRGWTQPWVEIFVM
jgi:hypothetical protein